MPTDTLDPAEQPRLPTYQGADASLFIAEVAALIWIVAVIFQVGRETLGPRQGILSGDVAVARGVMAALWLIAAIGATVLGFDSLKTIKKSEGQWSGRGEAVTAIAISLGTLVITLLALGGYGLVMSGWLSGWLGG